MHMHLIVVDQPLSEAVECACLTEGGKCHEANTFDYNFWNKYWSEDVPDVFSTVEKLKLAAAEGRPIAQIKTESSSLDAAAVAPPPVAPATAAPAPPPVASPPSPPPAPSPPPP